MTTYQDQPPLSRRAIRNGERAESSPQEPTFPVSGEPLVYATQNRPPLPGYESPAHGRRAAVPSPEAASADAPPTDAEEHSGQRFRRRDYSPEGRTSLAPWATAPAPDPEGGIVEYRTQGRPTVAPDPGPQSSPQPSPQPAPPSSEHTMTRRELRALRERNRIASAGPAAAPAQPDVARPDPAARPEPADESPAPQASERPTPLVEPRPSAQSEPLVEPMASYRSALAEFDALTTGSSMPVAAPTPPTTERPEPLRPPEPASQPEVSPTPVAEPQPAVPPPPVAAPQYLPPQPSALSTGERPVGHWTNQADLDDAVHGSLATGSRGVRTGGAITTSALVLPSLPGQDLVTGEVMVTGSINLPEALSSTGAHPSQLDQSHLDHLLDAEDEQVVNTDSIPIRAIKAVSSHTSTRGVIAAQKPRGTKALTALIISASGMAVVVVTLLVVAIATNVFGS